ncbi:MAG TPA: gamma carbonic anhydrase family protein [candidate division WOR-3 bacterium]|uniref:Gamma carbonic anhydrase family protein n=1 Tax=candidate division WOR-3 bacterium TaxID=2052148 RepID=A0A7V0T4M6_UNCW3|nr:gamma carbonic anhydrase family protein [candidate division WOR-3 bacterium]
MLLEFQKYLPRLGRDVFVAPNATVVGRVVLGDRASVWFGSVLRGDVDRLIIGAETNIQDLTVVHADADTPTEVGSRVTVGHRAILHGCHIGDECVIGMGAIVQNRARVGSHAIVASGSVVREGFEVPPGTLVAGVPAKVKRELSETEIEYINELAEIYLGRAELYREQRGPQE